MILMFFILCFVAIYYWSKDLVKNRQVYQLRMLFFCLVSYALFNAIGVLI